MKSERSREKPLITYLRVCYTWKLISLKKTVPKWNLYSALLPTERKRWKEKRDTCPKSLSCFFACGLNAKPEQYPFLLPAVK